MILSILLPAYQEAENLRNILPKIHSALASLDITYEVLVVDTMQPMDETETVCLHNDAVYINREGGNLYGDAMRTGFAKAAGRYVVVMDADGSHSPSDITRLYEKMDTGKYDLVIGSRYCRGGHTDNNFILIAMSRVLNITYKIMFGLKVKDVSDSFRMYKGEQLKSLRTECDNFDIVEEILISLNYTIPNFSVCEIPISFNKRAAGESKRDLFKFIKSYIHTMNRLMRIKSRAKKDNKTVNVKE